MTKLIKRSGTITNSKPALILVIPQGNYALMKEIQGFYESNPALKLITARTFDHAAAQVNRSSSSILLAEVNRYENLRDLVGIFSQIKDRVDAGHTRIMVMSKFVDPKMALILERLRCSSTLSPSEKLASARAKLEPFLLPPDSAPHSDEGIFQSPAEANFGVDSNISIQLLPALEGLRDDCWLIDKDSIRRVNQSWIFSMIGPGINFGRWVKSIRPKPGSEGAWEWVPRFSKTDPFVRNGIWTFFGRQPELKDSKWLMVSREPQLVYSQKSKLIACRLKLNNRGALALAQNSNGTLARKAELLASHEANLTLKTPEPAQGLPGYRLDEEQARIARDYLDEAAEAPGSPDFLDRRELFRKAEAKLAPSSLLFAPVESLEEKNLYYKESGGTQGRATVWIQSQVLRFDTTVDRYSPAQGTLLIRYPRKMGQPDFLRALRDFAPKYIFFNINLARAAVFFRVEAEKIRAAADGLEVVLPQYLYEVKRRSHLRLELDRLLDREILFDEAIADFPVSDFRLKDIGAGGMRANFRPDPSGPRIKPGLKFRKILFRLHGQPIQCMGEIRWIRPSRDEPGSPPRVEVGIRFLELKARDQERIRLFVMEQSLHYLTHYLVPDEGPS